MFVCVLIAEIDKKSKKMKDAEKFDVPIVSEDYLEAVKKGGAQLMISQHSIASWGSNKVCYLVAVVMFNLSNTHNFHVPFGQVEAKICQPTAKSTSLGLSDTNFFVPCSRPTVK